jgi:hypothetical protein
MDDHPLDSSVTMIYRAQFVDHGNDVRGVERIEPRQMPRPLRLRTR